VRGPRLPDVLRARGENRLPRGRPRPRATWTLVCLGLVVSSSALALIGLLYGVAWLGVHAVAGPRDELGEVASIVLGNAVVLAVTRRLTRGMLALWLAESAPEADAADRWLAELQTAPDGG
jgi:hypothetical protein